MRLNITFVRTLPVLYISRVNPYPANVENMVSS